MPDLIVVLSSQKIMQAYTVFISCVICWLPEKSTHTRTYIHVYCCADVKIYGSFLCKEVWPADSAVTTLYIQRRGKKMFIHTAGGAIHLKSMFNVLLFQYEDSATSPEHWRFFRRRAGEKGSNALEQTLPQGTS